MKRKRKPTLIEGFAEFEEWLLAQGVGQDESFIVAMWW